MKAWLDPDLSENEYRYELYTWWDNLLKLYIKDRKQCGFFLPEMVASVAVVF